MSRRPATDIARLRGLAAIVATLALAGCATPSAAGSIPGVVTSVPAPAQQSSSPAPMGSAVAVARQFLTDMQQGACPSAYALATDPLRTEAGSSGGLCGILPPRATFELGATTELTSTSVFVQATLTVGRVPRTATLTLLYQSTGWLVSNILGGGGSSAGGSPTSLSTIVAMVEQQFGTYNGGASAVVTCPQSGYGTVTPGETVTCPYVDSRGRSGSLTIVVENASGAFRWTIP